MDWIKQVCKCPSKDDRLPAEEHGYNHMTNFFFNFEALFLSLEWVDGASNLNWPCRLLIASTAVLGYILHSREWLYSKMAQALNEHKYEIIYSLLNGTTAKLCYVDSTGTEYWLRHSIHLSTFYTLHCVWTGLNKWYPFKQVIHLSGIHLGRFVCL